jgi:hypothetical protein
MKAAKAGIQSAETGVEAIRSMIGKKTGTKVARSK